MANGNQIVKYELDNGQSVELSPEIIRNYLVNGDSKVTDQEVHMFLRLCQYQKINPFLRECYLIKYGSQPAQMVCGKELFTKRAESHPDFDGYEAGVIVLTQDKKLVNRPGTTFLKAFGETLIGGWAKVYRKNYRIPIESTAMFEEYTTGKALWASKPCTMVRKVALVQALREAFPDLYGGLYSQEEMPVDGERLPTAPAIPEGESKAPDADQPAGASDIITTSQARLLFANADKDTVRRVILEFGYATTKAIRKADFDGILKRLADIKLGEADTVETAATETSGEEPFDDQLPFAADDNPAA